MPLLPEYNWPRLEEKSASVVEEAIRSLPSEILAEAETLPVVYRQWHPDAESGDDEASELLGEYLSFEEDRVSEAMGPIVLYLGAIRRYCLEEDLSFEEEVRATYLHELGHHFGWDEDDLASRDLA